jgi:hypothetical protein
MQMNSTPVQISAEHPITITMQAQHWQTVLNALQEMPFRMANPVVQELTKQFQQAMGTQQVEITPTHSNGNGIDREIPQN